MPQFLTRPEVACDGVYQALVQPIAKLVDNHVIRIPAQIAQRWTFRSRLQACDNLLDIILYIWPLDARAQLLTGRVPQS